MKALVFYSSTDRKGRKDATGAFIPEAKAFAKIHEVPQRDLIAIPQNISIVKRRRRFQKAIKDHPPVGPVGFQVGEYDAVVYFGHGGSRSLPGIGYSCSAKPKWTPQALAYHLTGVLKMHGTVVLYACLAGKGAGFADELARELQFMAACACSSSGTQGPRVIAHLTAGHTTWNPKAEYSGEGPAESGEPIIARGDVLWRRWVKRLRNDQVFRLSFPFMSRGEIAAALSDDHIPPGPSRLLGERP